MSTRDEIRQMAEEAVRLQRGLEKWLSSYTSELFARRLSRFLFLLVADATACYDVYLDDHIAFRQFLSRTFFKLGRRLKSG